MFSLCDGTTQHRPIKVDVLVGFKMELLKNRFVFGEIDPLRIQQKFKKKYRGSPSLYMILTAINDTK